VLTKLRSKESLTAKEKITHENGLVSVLCQLHDELDAAVFAAYGWQATLSDEETLTRIVALNAERVREEAQGVVRWLRPEYQKIASIEPAKQASLGLDDIAEGTNSMAPSKSTWPNTLPEQVQAVRLALAAAGRPVKAEAVARTFLRARTDKVGVLLATLAAIGQAREVEPGSYVG